MTMSDPLADMLTRIRNGHQARHAVVRCPYSKIKKHVLDVLQEEGYIRASRTETVRTNVMDLLIELKYHDNQAAIKKLVSISKPGRRVYKSVDQLPKSYNGLGTIVVSTPKGVMSDHKARQLNVGGELICSVF